MIIPLLKANTRSDGDRRPGTLPADLVTVHDLNLVARFADQAVVMDAGTVYGSGTPAQVITETMLREVYQIEARIQQYEDGTVTLAATRSL
jgi:iron complex transport system ATP-binding protein